MNDNLSAKVYSRTCIEMTSTSSEFIHCHGFLVKCFYPLINANIALSRRVGQSVASLLRRLGLPYQGNESRGKIKISGLAMKRWFQPKLASFTGKPGELGSSQFQLGKGITHQQRNIRTGNLSSD